MDHLATYLEDHHALSLGGLRLARRCERENRDSALGDFLAKLVEELEEDRTVLGDVLRAAGGTPSALKQLALTAGELAGRLKPNGKLLGYSDLSRVWELEGLLAGTESRRGMWKVLVKLQRKDPRLAGFDFEALEERARGHRDQLERHRLIAAQTAFASAQKRARTGVPAHVPR